MNKLLKRTLVFSIAGILAGCGLETPTEEEVPEETDTGTETGTETDTGTETAQDPEVTLVYAEVNPLDSIAGEMATEFKEQVETLSNGEIEIDLQPNGVLGAEEDVLDTMMGGGGTVDMARISAFALTSYGGEKSTLLSLPYTFTSRDHFWNFADSDLAQDFLLEPQENGSGVRGLFYGEEGFRHFFTTADIESFEDLQGLSLRVSADPIMTGLVEGIGASPSVVSFSELYSSLQTGVVDGAEQPIANYYSNAFHEVAPNLLLNAHTLGAIQVIIEDNVWDSLSEDHQNVLLEAGVLASEHNREISESFEQDILDQLADEGVNIIEIDDMSQWQEAVDDIVEQYSADYQEEYDEIMNMQ